MADEICVKAKCCKDKPRCKRCPVVFKRLESAGVVERTGKRTYLVAEDGIPKPAMKAARRNKPVPVAR